MTFTVLLYGATGYTGRLIAEELQSRNGASCRLILAGRDGACVEAIAGELDVEYRVFGLDHREDVKRGLGDVDVVINSAGPFAWTAERLAKVALEVECHYVDINGEADVYRKLDDLDIFAKQRNVALVGGAGFWAAASDVLLDHALTHLKEPQFDYLSEDQQSTYPIGGPDSVKVRQLGAVQIAMSRIKTFSRASAETVWRSLREQVVVVREGDVDDRKGGTRKEMVVWHEPVGKIERTFDFSKPAGKADRRIASVTSLVDTLTARLTVARHTFRASSIESYVEMDRTGRALYKAASVAVPVTAIPAFSVLVHQSLRAVNLSPGPTRDERARERHLILLEIEDRFHTRILDWRWDTPNVYQFTAQLVAAVAEQVASGAFAGWRTPGDVLAPLKLLSQAPAGPVRGCELAKRPL